MNKKNLEKLINEGYKIDNTKVFGIEPDHYNYLKKGDEGILYDSKRDRVVVKYNLGDKID
jgi:hypothetical protein